MWITYSITVNGIVRHVGVMRMGEAVNIKHCGALTPHHAFDTEAAAEAYRQQLIAHWNVTDNARALYKRTAVECLTNGTTYANAAAAARAMGINPATLSLHLNHPDQHSNAGGYVFRRVT